MAEPAKPLWTETTDLTHYWGLSLQALERIPVVAWRVRLARQVCDERARAKSGRLQPFVAALADLLIADLTSDPQIRYA